MSLVLVEFRSARTHQWTFFGWFTPASARQFLENRSSKFWRVMQGTTKSLVTIYDGDESD